MDSATFSSAPKDAQLSEFAISGLYEDLLVKQYGESMVSDVTKTRDLILVLLAKSVENREQAVHLSKQCFGEKALEVMTTFQQRLAEANKAPKKKSKSKKSSSSSSSATAAAAAAAAAGAGKVVVKLEAGDSNVVEMLSVDDGAKKKSKSASASSANVTSSNEKSPQTDPKPASPVSGVAVVPEVVALTSESKKTKSSGGGKKRKVGDSESEA